MRPKPEAKKESIKITWTVVRDSKYNTIRAFVPSELAKKFESLFCSNVKQSGANQFIGEITCACK